MPCHRDGHSSAKLSVVNLERDCALPHAEREWPESAFDKPGACARTYHRILRIARTIADLAGGTGCVEQPHLAEALRYRRFSCKDDSHQLKICLLYKNS